MDVHADLVERWAGLAADLGLGAGADELRDELLAAYTEDRRHYHTASHLAAVLHVLDELHAPEPPPATSRAAAWFHDAVYDTRRDDNEPASARLARQRLGSRGVDGAAVELVAALVAATATHESAPALAGAGELLDADLAVLGGDRDDYLAYAAAVRAEYGHLDEATFRTGRAAVLRRLAGREVLYHTARGAARYDRAARDNLAFELRLLEAAEAGRPR